MVFDHAESIGDSGEPVRRRVGAVGVLDSVVGGPRAPYNRFRRVDSVFIGFLGRRIEIGNIFKSVQQHVGAQGVLRGVVERGPCSP